MRIEISPKARQHLLAITDYYAEWGGVRSVERLLGYRSVIINDYYKMIYRLDDDVITIAAFWDMRMNPNKLKRMI